MQDKLVLDIQIIYSRADASVRLVDQLVNMLLSNQILISRTLYCHLYVNLGTLKCS